MSQPVTIKSRFIDGGTRILRPIYNRIIIEREPTTQAFGVIIGVMGKDSVDVLTSKVLSISDDAKVSTKRGPLAVGDRVIHVRVVDRRADSIETRSDDGEAISFLPAEHVLGVVTEDEILPANDMILVESAPDTRMVGSLFMAGYSSTDVHSSKVLATGPDAKHHTVGQFAIHIKVNGIVLESPSIRRRFGNGLKLIRDRSTMGTSSSPVEDVPGLETFPDYVPEIPRGLVDRR